MAALIVGSIAVSIAGVDMARVASASSDSYSSCYYEIPNVMGMVLEIPTEWAHQQLEADPPYAYEMLSMKNPEGTALTDLRFYPLIPGMISYTSVREFAGSVKDLYLKYPRRLLSEKPRRIADYDFYELVIEVPPGRNIMLFLKEERGCWLFEMLFYDVGKESVTRPILERMASTFRPAFKVTLESNIPVPVKVDGRVENSPGVIYVSPFRSHVFEVPPVLDTGPYAPLIRYCFSHWGSDVSSFDLSVTIEAKGAKVVATVWKPDYTHLYTLLAALTILSVLSAFVYTRQRRKDRPLETTKTIEVQQEGTEPMQSLKPCVGCGAVIPSVSEYCDECGIKQTTEVKR